ncbi:unnamed protein product [Heligmosomoides polygyrus]|uniref:Flocculation protein FLO11-like n=1 Tax=Heligmosomoides polygyrus TaxID=6339 RepID=A0A183F4J2_HELPZ|nr:unnamed protein product [Heligmosomoides polygyrus]
MKLDVHENDLNSVVESSNFSLWIVPVTRVFAVPPPPPPKKVRVVKKVVKKRTPNEDPFDENGDKRKLIRVVRKKLEKKDGSPSPEANGVLTNGTSPARTPSEGSLTANGSKEPSVSKEASVERSPNPTSNGVPPACTSRTSSSQDEAENSSLSELRKKLMQASESTSAGGFEFRAQSQLQRVSSGRKSLTPDRRLDPIYEGTGRKERSVSPVKIHVQEVVCRANGAGVEFPVVCLQLILGKCFTYEQV